MSEAKRIGEIIPGETFSRLDPESQKTSQTDIPLEVDRYRTAWQVFMKALELKVLQEGGKPLVIDQQIEGPLELYIAWASGNHKRLVELEPTFSPHKGMVLRGNVGSGKSILFRTHKALLMHDEYRKLFRSLTFGTCEAVAKQFGKGGDQFIEKYGSGAVTFEYGRPVLSHRCFDDLGNEEAKNYYGNFKEVMKDVISERYDLFVEYQLTTCFTTNLPMDEIEKRYDKRTRSRIEQMCNIIGIGTSRDAYIDRRKQ